jgi:hypothetical protein
MSTSANGIRTIGLRHHQDYWTRSGFPTPLPRLDPETLQKLPASRYALGQMIIMLHGEAVRAYAGVWRDEMTTVKPMVQIDKETGEIVYLNGILKEMPVEEAFDLVKLLVEKQTV